MSLQSLDLVRALGAREYETPGRMWYPQLQITFALGALRRRTWDDNPQARLKRHLLMIGPRGTWKGSIATRMFRLAGIRYHDDPEATALNPRTVEMGSEDNVRMERLRGSVSDRGDFIRPLLMGANYLYASELVDTMGSDPRRAASKAYSLNTMLEDGRVSVGLLKMASLRGAKLETAVEAVTSAGGHYDRMTHTYSFYTNLSMIACSHPFTRQQSSVFHDNGFTSRFTTVEWRPSAEEYRKVWDRGPYMDPNAQAYVGPFNAHLWQSEIGTLNYPSRDHIKMVQNVFGDIYAEIEKEFGASPTTLRSGRDHAEFARLITAFAFMRRVEEAKGPVKIEVFEYEPIDAENAAEFARESLKSLYDQWLNNPIEERKEKEDGPIVDYWKLLLDFSKSNGVDHEQPNFRSAILKKWLATRLRPGHTVHEVTIYRHMNKMREEGLLKTIGAGDWAIDGKLSDHFYEEHTADAREAGEMFEILKANEPESDHG